MFQFAGFPPPGLWIQPGVTGGFPAGFPHSGIRGSLDICSSPRLFAACRAFRRLLVPRHPPCALSCLTRCFSLQLSPASPPSVALPRVFPDSHPALSDFGFVHSTLRALLPASRRSFSLCSMSDGVSPIVWFSFCQYSVFKVRLAVYSADGLRWTRTTLPAGLMACLLGMPPCGALKSFTASLFIVVPAATCSPTPSPA